MAAPEKQRESSAARTEPSRSGGTAPAPSRRGSMPSPLERWAPMRLIRDEFDRMFEQFFGGGWPVARQGEMADRRWDLDVKEDDDSVVVRAEAPGFEPSDFDVQVRGDELILRAEHKSESEDKDLGFYQSQEKQLCRSVALPTSVDPAKVEARYRNGVLTIRMPKAAESKARRISVQG